MKIADESQRWPKSNETSSCIILGEITKEPQGAGKCEDKKGSIMMNGQAEGKREDERLGEKLDGERRYRTVGQNSQKYILKY